MYSEYAKYFDKIFPANNKTVQFLETHLQENKILDIGCGSGEYVNALHKRNYVIKGIDLDLEMINYAKEKNPNVTFEVQNMLDMSEEIYDSIYCIGNTLVHLPDKQDILMFLKDCYSKLDDGTLVLQIINYERIIENGITSLPTIENEGITFTRNYELKKDKIVFSTILKTEDKNYESDVELFPLYKEDLEMMLKEVGFKKVESYNGFSDAKYTKDSYALVVVAHK